MKRYEWYEVMYGISLVLLVFTLVVFLSGCGPKTEKGAQGVQGIQGTPGSSCTVVSETYGALIVCGDGTSVQIHNGQDGKRCSLPKNNKHKYCKCEDKDDDIAIGVIIISDKDGKKKDKK